MPDQRQPKVLHIVVAGNVVARRRVLGMSQEDLADVCGLHRTYVSAIERAQRNVTLATLESLSYGLHCDPVDLLTKG